MDVVEEVIEPPDDAAPEEEEEDVPEELDGERSRQIRLPLTNT